MNLVTAEIAERDLDLLFGPFDPGDVTVKLAEPFPSLAEIACRYVKAFHSLTQARKNGWDGECPRGFREWKLGKRRFWTFRYLERYED